MRTHHTEKTQGVGTDLPINTLGGGTDVPTNT